MCAEILTEHVIKNKWREIYYIVQEDIKYENRPMGTTTTQKFHLMLNKAKTIPRNYFKPSLVSVQNDQNTKTKMTKPRP